METLQITSIVLEAIIVLVAIAAALLRKKNYAWGFALTFAIYVYYDLAKLMDWEAFSSMLYPLFFIATLSALASIVALYKRY